MKILASTQWGSCRKVMRMFYILYIRSKIAYGSIVYAGASENNLNKLDKLKNVALRMITGGRRSSPILSLEVEANVPPLSHRRKLMVCKHMIKLLYRPKGDGTTAILGLDGGKVGPTNTYMLRASSYMKAYGITHRERKYCGRVQIAAPFLRTM